MVLSVSPKNWGEQRDCTDDPLNFSESGWWGRGFCHLSRRPRKSADLFLDLQPFEVTDDRLKMGALHLAELFACLSMFYQLLNDIPI